MTTSVLEGLAVDDDRDSTSVLPESLEASPIEAAELVRESVEVLWQMYQGRRVGMRYDFSCQIVEERVLATRFFDESGVEELYRVTDFYRLGTKEHRSQRIEVLIKTEVGEAVIIVDENGDLTVRQRERTDDEWELLGDEEAAHQVFELQHRALAAAEKHYTRSEEDRLEADEDAREKTLEIVPQFRRSRGLVE